MSKPETNIISVPLANAYLNLNQEKDEIRQYEGFNKLNAPFYGGNLSPMYKKFLGASGASSYTDENETVYTIENGVFTKKEHNGNTEVLKDDFQTYTAEETILDNRTYKWYYDSDNYAVITDTGSVTVVLHGITVGTYNNFNKIFFDSERAVIITSLKAICVFEGTTVEEIEITTTSRTVSPSYTVYNDVMIISVNHKLYAFRLDGTVTELTVTYTGNVTITYGITMLTVNINDEEPEDIYYRNYFDSNDVEIDISTISSNTILNGEQSMASDSESHTSSGNSIKGYIINNNKTYIEWLYNGEHDFNNTDNSDFILNPYKNKIMIPSTMCVTSECLSNNSVGIHWGSPITLDQGSFLYSIAKRYNIYNITDASFSSLVDNSITIDLTVEKITTLLNKSKIKIASDTTEYAHANYYRASVRSFAGFYSVETIDHSADSYLLDLLNTYKNLFEYEIKPRNCFNEITGSFELGELKKETSDIALEDNFSFDVTATYNTPFYSYNLSFIDNPQDYALNTTRGYAVNISDYFRVLVNSNYIAAVSMFNYSNCLGTLVSNFGTTGIEYIYAVSDERLVYVDDKNKVHIIDVIEFSGNEIMTVLLGRYFVFNAIGVNCYDGVSRTWSRVGLDWNNRFVIADYSESADTKYYMTSAMFRTTDNNPSLSMLFNVDYLNKLPYTALTPQYAEDAVIQLYGTEDVNDSALYLGSFVFSSDE